MTGLQHEREFSRKSFVKGGGALVVGFSTLGVGLAGKASAAAPTPAGWEPDISQLDSWLAIGADNTAVLKMSEIEIGNGITTGMLMIAAEELNMDLSQMRYSSSVENSLGVDATVVDSWKAVNSGSTGGSHATLQEAGPVRAAASTAYQALLGMASTKLNVPVSVLSASGGVISGGGSSVTYGELMGGQFFNLTIPGSTPGAPGTGNGAVGSLAPGQAPAKPVADYTLVGTVPQRIDIPNIASGAYTYVQNLRIPGMLHGRLVRPRGQGAVGSLNYQIESVDSSSIAHLAGAKIVQRGNLLGVVAPLEYDAVQAAAELKVTWKSDPLFPSNGDIFEQMRAQDTAGMTTQSYYDTVGNVPVALATAAHTLSATYTYPYQSHASLGPTCAVADVKGTTSATIWAQMQEVDQAPAYVSNVTGVPIPNIQAIFYEGASTYGPGSTYQDTMLAAAILSQEAGAPVRLQLMRWDENGWDHQGPAHMFDVTGGLDANGNIVAMDWAAFRTVYTPTGIMANGSTAVGQMQPTVEHAGVAVWPSPAAAAAAAPTDEDHAVGAVGDYMYNVFNTNHRSLAKVLPIYNGYPRDSSLRAPLYLQKDFASEQFIDELAHLANMDPIEFRLQNMVPPNDTTDASPVGGARFVAAIEAVANAAGWKPRVANSVSQTGDIVTGRGIAIGQNAESQVAMVANISVNKKSGKLTAKHLWSAVNVGMVVNPHLVANNQSGAAIQAVSRALHEEVTFTKERVTSLDWVSYPILRMMDAPTINMYIVLPNTVIEIDPEDLTQNASAGNVAAIENGWISTGAGEVSSVTPAAAIANAFFDATGVRIRSAPMTPSRVRAVLQAADVA